MTGVLGLLEQTANQIVSAIPYSRLKIWKETLFHPSKTMAGQKGKPSLKTALADVSVAAAIMMSEFLLLFLIFRKFPGSEVLQSDRPFLFVILGSILLIPFYLVAWLVWSITQYMPAKMFGGLGSFKQHAYLMGLVFAAALIINSVITPFLFILPQINDIANVLISGYMAYLSYILIVELHKISKLKAIAAVILSPILGIIGVVCILFILNLLTNGLVLQLLSSPRQAPV